MPKVTYDEAADVLYLNYAPGAPADKGREDRAGVVRRYTASGDLIGVTILDFAHRMMGSDYVISMPPKS